MPYAHHRRNRFFNRLRNPAYGGLLAGFVAALLTIALRWFGQRLTLPIVAMLIASNLFIGWIFGAVIAAYLYFVLRRRTVLGAIGFILSCTVIYWLSMFMMRLPIPPIAFAAGAVGTYLVLMSVFVCFFQEENLLVGPLRWSLWGGAFGLIGWVVGFPAFLPYSEWIVWQSGMGYVIGRIVSQEQASAADMAESSIPSTSESGRSRLMVRICLLAFSAIALVMAFYKDFPGEYKDALRLANDVRRDKAKPSLRDLPGVQALPPQQVLLLRQFGSYLPESPESGPWSSGTPNTPQAHRYAVTYDLAADSPTREGYVGVGPHVTVQVREYPNVVTQNPKTKPV